MLVCMCVFNSLSISQGSDTIHLLVLIKAKSGDTSLSCHSNKNQTTLQSDTVI